MSTVAALQKARLRALRAPRSTRQTTKCQMTCSVALAKHAVVLLGETHDEVEHHRWQLHTIAVPFGHRPASVSRCFRGAFALRWQRAERSELG